MGITAFLCLLLGVYQKPLYDILPNPLDYVPYTWSHVLGHLQLAMFGGLGFCFLMLSGYYPPDVRAINLDLDWFYRKGGRLCYSLLDRVFNGLNSVCDRIFVGGLAGYLGRISRDGPARAALIVITPIWFLTGTKKEQRNLKKKRIYRALGAGASPVGISAALATLFLIVIYLMS
jgi:multicomponent Na+:H+ antiporter subunit D